MLSDCQNLNRLTGNRGRLHSAHWLASSLKLAARCPVSGCRPSCIPVRQVAGPSVNSCIVEVLLLRFFGESRPWVATRYCRDRSVVRWSWSSWNLWHSGTNEWKDETSQMPGGRSSQQLCEDRRSTCKDQYEKTRHKMCRHQLNGWSWKDDEKVRWK